MPSMMNTPRCVFTSPQSDIRFSRTVVERIFVCRVTPKLQESGVFCAFRQISGLFLGLTPTGTAFALEGSTTVQP
jgi:hypothetical protein